MAGKVVEKYYGLEMHSDEFAAQDAGTKAKGSDAQFFS
jgi:hypothetical protein